MNRKKIKLFIIFILLIGCISVSACSMKGEAADPSLWGYNCEVTYDTLGGLINAREVRTTYYLPNSYLFEPSGSSNMLVEPNLDGHILAGWYTAKSDNTDEHGLEYSFTPSDRWDFQLDRVQDDITLYARWIPQGKIDYVDADSGEIIFSKKITEDSPIQPLSSSVINLSTPEGYTFNGYFSDSQYTEKYDFNNYVHVSPHPNEADLYEELYEMFPQYLEKIDYIESEEDETDSNNDTSWLFLNKLGYDLITNDEEAIAEIRSAKDQLIERSIQEYLANTLNRVVYVKFTEGRYIVVNDAEDFKVGLNYGFFDTDSSGSHIDGYIINADIDLKNIDFTMSESFSGLVNGNGHKLTNLNVSVSSKKVDTDTEKSIGLSQIMDGAEINDLSIENATLSIQVNSGIKVTGGLFAVEGKNVTFNNCNFIGLNIVSGKGDDGKVRYTIGDLFGSYENCTFNNCTAYDLVPDVLNPDKLVLALFQLPIEVDETAEEPNSTTDGN